MTSLPHTTYSQEMDAAITLFQRQINDVFWTKEQMMQRAEILAGIYDVDAGKIMIELADGDKT
jgi:hypothetical protein